MTNYPQLDDVQFQGALAIEMALRTNADWQKRVSQQDRLWNVWYQACLAARLGAEYLNAKESNNG